MQNEKSMNVDFDGDTPPEMTAEARSAFHALVCLDTLDRMKSGELSDTNDFTPPESFMSRIADLLDERQQG